MAFRDHYAIAGLGLTAFGRLAGRSTLSIKAEAIRRAIQDAGLEPTDIDGLISQQDLGVTDSGGDLPRRLGIQPKFFWTLVAGGTSAISSILAAGGAIQSGLAQHVVCFCGANTLTASAVVGASRSTVSTPGAYGFFGPLGDHALMARRHMALYGTTREHLGAVAVGMRANANRRPEAQMYARPLTMEEYLLSPPIVEPFGRPDCCLNSDGGAAVVVTSAQRARDLPGPTVLISGIGLGHQVRQYQTKTNYVAYATGDAMVPAFREAGVQLNDVDFCELYEPFSIGVIVQLEDLGFCEKGEGGPFVADGNIRLDGSIPVNTSGGQASWCYLQGYTPLSEAVLQLTDRGGATQLSKANLALVTGHGGTNANSMMYSDGCLILKRHLVPAAKPLPDTADEMAYFWERAGAGVLVQQYCTACHAYLSPPAYDCAVCHSGPEHISWREVSGRGTVHTFNVYHRPYHPGFEEDLPYNTAIVELDEGPLVASRITGCDAGQITVGMPVAVTFVEHNGDPGLFIPMFAPPRP